MKRIQGRATQVVIAVVLVVGLLGLTACNGGAPGGESPLVSASPSANVAQASSSPVPDQMPEPTMTVTAASKTCAPWSS